MRENHSGPQQSGVRLNHLSLILVCLVIVITGLMVYSIYQTTGNARRIATVTQNFLNNQQTSGMLGDLSGSMSEQALAFVQSGQPGAAHTYIGQKTALEELGGTYIFGTTDSEAADKAYRLAKEAYNMQIGIDLRAMRLAADALPEPAFHALPELIQEMEISEEDHALSPEDKRKTALEMLTSDDYQAIRSTLATSVDDNHRLSSTEGQKQTEESSKRLGSIVREQFLLMLLFVFITVVFILTNRTLIISPIQKCVDHLDRREPIPVKGSYEMRHLAKVYNDVLRDNNEINEKLSFAATHDALTGLLNRAAFDKIYKQLQNGNIGILIADVDHFKRYNDEYGHDVGDQVLRNVAEALRNNFRSNDHICRIGGDEFCVIMPDLSHSYGDEIKQRIARINQELDETRGELPPVTMSAGAAFWNRPNPRGSIFKDADSTLLELKRTRDCCCAVYEG